MKLSESDLSFAWQCQSCGCYFPHIPKVLDDDVKRCSKCVEVEILEQRVEGLRNVAEEAERIANEAHLAADHYAYDLMRTVLRPLVGNMEKSVAEALAEEEA